MSVSNGLNWRLALECSDIPLREGRCVLFGEQEIAVFNLGESFAAIDNRCPHKQGPLADGIVSGDKVTCPLHNLNINLKTGCALKAGEGQVRAYEVKIENQKVYIRL